MFHNNPQNIYTRKELVMMETTVFNLVLVSIFQTFRSWSFALHKYKYWVQSTVVTFIELRLNAVNHSKMCNVSVIILRWQLLVFPIKKIIILHCKQIRFFGGYCTETCLFITTNSNKSIHKIMSTSFSVSSFLSDDSKQDAATTTAHSKRFIELFKTN